MTVTYDGGCSTLRRFDSLKVRGLGLGLEMYLVRLSDYRTFGLWNLRTIDTEPPLVHVFSLNQTPAYTVTYGASALQCMEWCPFTP